MIFVGLHRRLTCLTKGRKHRQLLQPLRPPTTVKSKVLPNFQRHCRVHWKNSWRFPGQSQTQISSLCSKKEGSVLEDMLRKKMEKGSWTQTWDLVQCYPAAPYKPYFRPLNSTYIIIYTLYDLNVIEYIDVYSIYLTVPTHQHVCCSGIFLSLTSKRYPSLLVDPTIRRSAPSVARLRWEVPRPVPRPESNISPGHHRSVGNIDRKPSGNHGFYQIWGWNPKKINIM